MNEKISIVSIFPLDELRRFFTTGHQTHHNVSIGLFDWIDGTPSTWQLLNGRFLIYTRMWVWSTQRYTTLPYSTLLNPTLPLV